MLALPLSAVLLALLASPAPALAAGTVSVDSGDLEYNGDAGANIVTFTDSPGSVAGQTTVTVSETGISENPNVTACVDNGDTVSCDVDTSSARAEAFLGAGNDVATNDTGLLCCWQLSGGADDDELTGADSSTVFDDIFGEEGSDRLFGRGGEDGLAGGPGDGDLVEGGSGHDTFEQGVGDGSGDLLRGGPAVDEVRFVASGPPTPGAIIDLGAGFMSNADGSERATLESIQDAWGNDGNDRITGTNGTNQLRSLDGDDQLDGLGGADRLDGEEGADTLQGRDGVNDLLLGGVGTDTCFLDQLDEQSGCENSLVESVPPFGVLPTPPPPPADQTGPVCSTRGLKSRIRREIAIEKGIAFTVRCDEDGRIDAALLGRVTGLPGGVQFSATGDLSFGTTRRSLGAGNRTRARLRVSRRLRRAFRRTSRIRIEIRATDALGNTRTTSKRIRLR